MHIRNRPIERARLFLLTLLAPLALAAPAHAAFPGQNGKIAFVGAGGIELINPDGSGETVLTSGTRPAWSQDGKRIAFVDAGPSDPNCGSGGIQCNNGDLYVINADGTGRTNLTSTTYATEGLEGGPAWTPDGRWITFTRYDPTGSGYRAFSIRPDGTGETQLPLPPGAIKSVAWSPDGGKLAYARQPGALPYLFTANPDGSGETRLCCANDFEWAKAPDWSPDGHALLFSHGNAPGTIMRVNADGSGLTILSDNQDDFESQVWSPDGTKIVFASAREQIHARLMLMNPDGSGVEELLSAPSVYPSWQPIPQRAHCPPKARGCSAPGRCDRWRHARSRARHHPPKCRHRGER
jgi:Tol biopolymer transport system component